MVRNFRWSNGSTSQFALRTIENLQAQVAA